MDFKPYLMFVPSILKLKSELYKQGGSNFMLK